MIILIGRDLSDRWFVNLTGGLDFAKFGHFIGLDGRFVIVHKRQLIKILGQKHNYIDVTCSCHHSRLQTGFGIVVPPLFSE